MALIQCPECKQQISDQAVACPHCGAPRQVVAPPAASPTPLSVAPQPVAPRPPPPVVTPAPASPAPTPGFSRGFGLAALIFVLAIAVFVVVRQPKSTGGAPLPPPAPVPRYAVDNAGADESCTALGDYCIRVKCAVTNVGEINGISRVAADYSENGQVIATHRGTTQMLVPGQQDTLTLDFPEATLESNQHQYRCYPLP